MSKDTVLGEHAAQAHDSGAAPTAEEQNALIQFILSIFGDEQKAADFADDPDGCMADAGLSHVTPQEVHHAVEAVAQNIPAPSGGGGGHWQPSYPDHGSAASVLQQITNNYYQQILNINGDNNHVDMKQVIASGDGAVAIGEDSNGNIATTGGTAGDGNTTHNTTDNDTTTVDKSIHGDGSGNTSGTAVDDHSRTDDHSSLGVKADGGGAQVPMQTFAPTPIAVDPAPAVAAAAVSASGGDIMTESHAAQPFTEVPDSVLLGDDPASNDYLDHVVHVSPDDPNVVGGDAPVEHDPPDFQPIEGTSVPDFFATDIDPGQHVDGPMDGGHYDVDHSGDPNSGLDPSITYAPDHVDPTALPVDSGYEPSGAESYVPEPVSAAPVVADAGPAPAVEFHDGS